MFYFEQRAWNGQWSPRTAPEPPVDVRTGRTPENVRAVQLINPGHHKLNLDQLREVYSPDGRFRNT